MSKDKSWEEQRQVQLIKVINNEGQLTVTSLEVTENFEKEHKNVIQSIENLIAENSAVKNMFIENTYKTDRGRTYPMYEMTRDGFTLLAMGFTGPKALQWKLKYIEAFNKMEQKLKEQVKVPKTYKEALLAIVEAEEEKEQLQLANKEKDNVIQLNKPKVIFADAVSASNTSILVGELAKLLKQNGIGTGQKRLFEWLRNNGFLIRRRGSDYNMPTQRAMEQELFEIKETSITHSDGHISVNKTPKVTGKGQQYFINKFLREQEL